MNEQGVEWPAVESSLVTVHSSGRGHGMGVAIAGGFFLTVAHVLPKGVDYFTGHADPAELAVRPLDAPQIRLTTFVPLADPFSDLAAAALCPRLSVDKSTRATHST